MRDVESLFADLHHQAEVGAADAIEQLVRQAPDARLNRVNPLAFAAEHGLGEAESIAAFLHASQFGLFDLSWNVTCASCGGVLGSAASLKALDRPHYSCALCATECEPVLDERIEVTFTVEPGIRRIDAHDPEHLPLWDYVRQIYLSSGSDLPAEMAPLIGEVMLGAVELPPGAHATQTFALREGLVMVFDPVSHASTNLEIAGPPVREPQELTLAIEADPPPGEAIRLAPGPLRLTLENHTGRRALPILWIAGPALVALVGRRIPFLTGKRLLSHQTFRDIFRTDVLGIDQRFKITSLTFLFTDLKGSTELYQRVGDLAAFDLVRVHFQALTEIIATEGGAVVKTIGDAVMATFPSPAEGLSAALRMHEAMKVMNARRGSEDMLLKIGLHSGPSLAVTLNDRQDYFGQTVNVAARVQGLASAGTVLATQPVLDDPAVAALLAGRGLSAISSMRRLRGIEEEVLVYEIACQAPAEGRRQTM